MSLLLVPFGLYAIGGLSGLHRTLDPNMFSLTATAGIKELTWTWVFATALTALIGLVAQPGLMALLGSGRTEMEARIGVHLRHDHQTVLRDGLGLHRPHRRGHGRAGEDQPRGARRPPRARVRIAIRDLLPVGMVGLMAASILASQMSSLSGQMVNASRWRRTTCFAASSTPARRQASAHRRPAVRPRRRDARGAAGQPSRNDCAGARDDDPGANTHRAADLGRRAVAAGKCAGAWAAFVVMALVLGASARSGRSSGLNSVGPDWLGRYAQPMNVPELLVSYVPRASSCSWSSRWSPSRSRKKVDDLFLLLRTPVGQEQKLIDAGVPIVYAGQTQPNYWETNHPRLVHWGGFVLAALHLCRDPRTAATAAAPRAIAPFSWHGLTAHERGTPRGSTCTHVEVSTPAAAWIAQPIWTTNEVRLSLQTRAAYCPTAVGTRLHGQDAHATRDCDEPRQCRRHHARRSDTLGVGPGDLLIVHGSLSSFGHVEGGAAPVAAALVGSVSPGGSVFVPTFTYAGSRSTPPTSPSFDGAITEAVDSSPARCGACTRRIRGPASGRTPRESSPATSTRRRSAPAAHRGDSGSATRRCC